MVVLERAIKAPRRRSPAYDRRGLLAFATPSVAWYVIFTIGPLVAMFLISLFSWRTFVSDRTFIGLGNYVELFQSSEFAIAAGNTALHMVAAIPVMMVSSFMIGYYLNLRPRGHRVLRVLMFAPALISVSALGTLFVTVLGPRGLINGLLDSLGLDYLTRAWLADPDTALLCIIAISIWSGTGFNAVLFSARLASVPSEIYEAAELDGASHWRRMWGISFPVISDYFGVLTMLAFLSTLFGSAGLILILTSGGPGYATTTLSWMVYKNAFLAFRIGFSQAIGVVLFILGVVGLVTIRRAFKQRY